MCVPPASFVLTESVFGAHAAATIIYTMILRNYPAAARNTPWIVGFLIVNAFSIITAPLFTVVRPAGRWVDADPAAVPQGAF